jgi:sigma-B regulation protein RsbU (phosphoserine phosphatase)
MFPDQSYDERKVVFGPGDLLCLYTDGIVESRKGEHEEYGDERLAERLRDLGSLPAPAIRDRIFEDVFAFSACEEAGDDMTLVVVKRNP